MSNKKESVAYLIALAEQLDTALARGEQLDFGDALAVEAWRDPRYPKVSAIYWLHNLYAGFRDEREAVRQRCDRADALIHAVRAYKAATERCDGIIDAERAMFAALNDLDQ